MMKENRLMDIKSQIESKEKEYHRLQGQLDSVLKNMKEEFGINDVDEAMAKLKEMKIDEKSMREAFESCLKALENAYDWD